MDALEDELERAKSIAMTLPHMSKTIVDDTLYEKVLSFLLSVLNKDPLHVAIFDQWGILAIVDEACQQVDQDYRVYTVCFRLLGGIVTCEPLMFTKLLEKPALLSRVTVGLRAPEAALRCASLEAFGGFASCIKGCEWLLANETAKTLLPLALMDESLYVVTQGCKLFCHLIECQHTGGEVYAEKIQALRDVMDPSIQISGLLKSGMDENLLLAALEFCWAVANSQTTSSFKYMAEKRTLSTLLPLLNDPNRIIRARVIEILAAIFDWAPAPLGLLLNHRQEHEDGPRQAYEYMISQCTDMITNPSNTASATTGVALMERSFSLLKRFPFSKTQDLDGPLSLLVGLLVLCIENKDPDERFSELKSHMTQGGRSLYFQRTLVHLILHTLNTLVVEFPVEAADVGVLDRSLKLLATPSLVKDRRVLKIALNLLLSLLRALADSPGAEKTKDVLSKSISQLVQLLDEADLDCRSAGLLLETFDTLLGHEKLGQLVSEPAMSQSFTIALNMKFVDPEWDVRDAAVEFTGRLFAHPRSTVKVQFALSRNLPNLVFGRIQDSEPYVRASALQVLQGMMKDSEGWVFIQQHPQARDVSTHLPRLLYDSEAFVRRAALETIASLVENRSCEGLAMHSENSNEDSLNPTIVAKLMDDPDSEVRIRACQLLEKLFLFHVQEDQQLKRAKSGALPPPSPEPHLHKVNTDVKTKPEEPFFYSVHGDTRILESVEDSHRLVRAETLRVVETILALFPTKDSQRGKRLMEDLVDRDAAFIEALSRIDLAKLRQNVNPEHLYQEAFDINAAMMTRSMEPTDPEDDVNMLDCY